MKDYQQAFISMAIEAEALCFGEFTLKSGRVSPYFFNAGLLFQSKSLSVQAKSYAHAIQAAGFEYDVIFGPAYKGISLAALACSALYDEFDVNTDFAYNRKEKKEHGEGGQLVGADLKGKRVLVIDDVITAGTAIREVAQLIEAAGGELAGVIIGLNRAERGQGDLSAVQEVEKDFGRPVHSIIDLSDIQAYLTESGDQAVLDKVNSYREQYGVKDEI